MIRASFSPPHSVPIALRYLTKDKDCYIERGRTEFTTKREWKVLLDGNVNDEALLQILIDTREIIAEVRIDRITATQNSDHSEAAMGQTRKLDILANNGSKIGVTLDSCTIRLHHSDETIFESHYCIENGDRFSADRSLQIPTPISNNAAFAKFNQISAQSDYETVSTYLKCPRIAYDIVRSFLSQVIKLIDEIYKSDVTNVCRQEILVYLQEQYVRTSGFKQSIHKSSGPHWTPVNLCIEEVWIGECPLIIGTYGAPSAHAFGHEPLISPKDQEGLFMPNALKQSTRLERCETLRELSEIIRRQNDTIFDGIIVESRQTVAQLKAECIGRLHKARKKGLNRIQALRKEVCFCNFVSAIGTCLSAVLDIASTTMPPAHLSIWCSNFQSKGLSVFCESLLSTKGPEKCMLEDYYAVIKECWQGRLSISVSSSDTSVEIGPFGDVFLNISHPSICIAKTKVLALLFTQGVNEIQTMANLLGETKLQETINEESLRKLTEWSLPIADEYLRSLVERLRYHIELSASGAPSLPASAPKFNPFSFRRHKHIEILEVAAIIAEYLNSITPVLRLVSCKSGKDRTAMSSTLSIRNTIFGKGFSSEGDDLREAMRGERGVRLQNVERNLGMSTDQCVGVSPSIRKPDVSESNLGSEGSVAPQFGSILPIRYTIGGFAGRFAFNKVQIGLLPERLRPPIRVTGNVAS